MLFSMYSPSSCEAMYRCCSSCTVVVVVVCPREPTRVKVRPGAAPGEAVRREEGRRRKEWLKESE